MWPLGTHTLEYAIVAICKSLFKGEKNLEAHLKPEEIEILACGSKWATSGSMGV